MPTALANALVPIFVGVLLGFYAGKRRLIDNANVRDLIVLVMNMAVPLAMFLIVTQSSWAVLRHQLKTAVVIALVFAVVYAGCYLWARRHWKMTIPDAAVLALTIGFPNCAAMALSLLADIYGSEAVISAALSIAVGSITVSPLTLALLDLTHSKDVPQISAAALARGVLHSFRQPVVWSPILALLFVLGGIHLPSYATAALKTLGNTANGSALILTGVVISAQQFRVTGPVIWTTLAKLIAQPMIAIGICLPLHVSQEHIRSIALISAIPGGFFGLVFGKSFNSTPEAASSGLIASYVLSIVTLPLWIVILARSA